MTVVVDPADPTGADDLAATIGVAVRQARQRAGLSMRQLAVRAGVTQPFVSQIEHGDSVPSIGTLYRLGLALGVQPADLLPRAAVAGAEVVRAGDGDEVAVSERPGAATARLVTRPGGFVEFYEYRIDPADDLDVWFSAPTDDFVFVIDGSLRVEFEGGATTVLEAGDALFHPGSPPHRWAVVGDRPVRALLLTAEPRPPA